MGTDSGTQFHEALLDSMSDGVYYIDRGGKITYWNHGAELMSGYTSAQVSGSRCSDGLLNHVDETGTELCGKLCPLRATMNDGQFREARVYMHHKDGHRQPVWVRASPLRDDTGEITGAVEVFRDDDEMATIRQRMGELEEQALTDPLTGVGNRRYIEGNLTEWLGDWTRHQERFGVLIIDFDKFKEVNDTYGHDAGDAGLTMVASTLRYGLQATDSLARWGGDEFLAITSAANDEELERVAERLRMLVGHSSIFTRTGLLSVTVSIGGALVQHRDSAEMLIARADRNLLHAKRAGRNCVVIRPAPFVAPQRSGAADDEPARPRASVRAAKAKREAMLRGEAAAGRDGSADSTASS